MSPTLPLLHGCVPDPLDALVEVLRLARREVVDHAGRAPGSRASRRARRRSPRAPTSPGRRPPSSGSRSSIRRPRRDASRPSGPRRSDTPPGRPGPWRRGRSSGSPGAARRRRAGRRRPAGRARRPSVIGTSQSIRMPSRTSLRQAPSVVVVLISLLGRMWSALRPGRLPRRRAPRGPVAPLAHAQCITIDQSRRGTQTWGARYASSTAATGPSCRSWTARARRGRSSGRAPARAAARCTTCGWTAGRGRSSWCTRRDAVYYVIEGGGTVLEASAQEGRALRAGSMFHVDAGTAYAVRAADGGIELVGGPAPADDALYAHLDA